MNIHVKGSSAFGWVSSSGRASALVAEMGDGFHVPPGKSIFSVQAPLALP